MPSASGEARPRRGPSRLASERFSRPASRYGATRFFSFNAGYPVTQWILASDGAPFRDRDAARIKRDLLVRDLGEGVHLEVVDHPSGGFAVSLDPPGSIEIAPGETLSPRAALLRTLEHGDASVAVSPRGAGARASTDLEPARASPTAIPAADPPATGAYPENLRLSPAARAFLGLHLQALLGVVLLFRPHGVFVLTGLGLPQHPTLGALLLTAIAGCGVLLAVLALSRFVWAFTANTYLVDRDGVEQVQWYFERGRLRRRAPRVNFAHLRSVDVDQSVLQMMLDVGSVKLAAGATDSYEVVLRHVSHPRALQREFQRRLHEVSGALRPAPAPRDL